MPRQDAAPAGGACPRASRSRRSLARSVPAVDPGRRRRLASAAAKMPARPGTLHGTRVLDLTAEPGFLAGKLLGDLGADVVKIEPPGGDPARRRPPFWGGAPDPERSLLWLALNTSKRGITLDLERPRGRELFLALVDHADVLLETEPPGQMAARGLDW